MVSSAEAKLLQQIPERRDLAFDLQIVAALNDSLRDMDARITDLQNLSHQLHSTKLEHLGLRVALKEERSRIARELHDDIGQRLSSIASLAAMTRSLPVRLFKT